jgi:dCTP deaminase
MPTGMILTRKRIFEYLSAREIVVDPILDKEQINCASIDLRLDNYFMEFKTAKTGIIDPAKIQDEYRNFLESVELELFRDVYYLQPKKFILAQTFEYLVLPNHIVGHLDGRSTVAREGLTVHAAAGMVDPGFKGHLVFEMLNAGEMPIKLYPLMKVAKIAFHDTEKTLKYPGQYNIQVRIRPPGKDKDLNRLLKLFKEKT